MNRQTSVSALMLMAALAACGGSSPESSEPAAPSAGEEQPAPMAMAEPAPAPEAMSEPDAEPTARSTGSPTRLPENSLAVASAVFSHKVKDFDAWKKAFDESQPARQAAGIVAHHVSRGVDDPSLVAVYVVGTDAEKLAAFFKSPELKATMKGAGVKGKPAIHLLTAVENKVATDPMLPAVIVMHTVKDFDAWKLGFDEDAAVRADAGVVGASISRDTEEPNLVVAYLQASAIEPLKALGASKELKAKMKAAGVKGKAEMLYVQGVERVQYR